MVLTSLNDLTEAATSPATRCTIDEPFMVAGQEITVSTSIGIALAPDDGTGPDNC